MLFDKLIGKRDGDPLVSHFTFNQLSSSDVDNPLLKEIFALRYEVYCLECGFLEPQDYQDRIETDEYEGRSFHVAAHHNLDGEIVGTVRLIEASAGQYFPFEEHCTFFDSFGFPPREQCGEISRLVVRKSYRRRPGDSMQGMSKEFLEKGNAASIEAEATTGHATERRSSRPEVLLGMYRELYRYSRKAGIRYWFAAMEQPLARSLSRIGVRFLPVGPETDYYGPVTPFMIDLRKLEVTMSKESPLLAAWFKDEPITLWLMLRVWIHTKFMPPGKRMRIN